MSLRLALASVLFVGCAPLEGGPPPDLTTDPADLLEPRLGPIPLPETYTTAEPEPEDVDGDGAIAAVDCDDSDPHVFPGAPELCDDRPNSCDSAWTADLEIGRVSMESEDGRWYDMTYTANGIGGIPNLPALLQVPAGATLWFCEGSWLAHVAVADGGSVVGRHGADTADIGGKGGSVVTAAPGAHITIDGLTLTSGTGTAGTDGLSRGGAIYGEDAVIDVVDAIVIANAAVEGGGAWLGAGAITSTGTDWGHGGSDNAPEDLRVAGKRVKQAPDDFACADDDCDITE